MIGQKGMMSADKDDIDNDDYMIRQAGIHQTSYKLLTIIIGAWVHYRKSNNDFLV